MPEPTPKIIEEESSEQLLSVIPLSHEQIKAAQTKSPPLRCSDDDDAKFLPTEPSPRLRSTVVLHDTRTASPLSSKEDEHAEVNNTAAVLPAPIALCERPPLSFDIGGVAVAYGPAQSSKSWLSSRRPLAQNHNKQSVSAVRLQISTFSQTKNLRAQLEFWISASLCTRTHEALDALPA